MTLQASKAEQDLVHMALQITTETASKYSELLPIQKKCRRPMPFFGPIERAQVITFGLNPSSHEFTKERNWSDVTDAQLPEELVNYWNNRGRPPHKWFNPWNTILSELGVSYSSTAAHIDLSPRATNSRKMQLEDLFVSMLQTDAPLWISALRCAAKCKFILAAGAATKRFYINEFICKKLAHTGVRLRGDWHRKGGKGQTASHTLYLPGDSRELPFFFCSTGPTDRDGTLEGTFQAMIGLLKQCLTRTGHPPHN